LQQQVLGRQHKYRTFAGECDKLRSPAQLHRLAEADIVGEDESRLTKGVDLGGRRIIKKKINRGEPNALP
jgi:hypothetical protein